MAKPGADGARKRIFSTGLQSLMAVRLDEFVKRPRPRRSKERFAGNGIEGHEGPKITLFLVSNTSLYLTLLCQPHVFTPSARYSRSGICLRIDFREGGVYLRKGKGLKSILGLLVRFGAYAQNRGA